MVPLLLLGSLAFADPVVTHVVSGSTAPTYPLVAGQGSAKLLLNASTGSREAALDVLELVVGASVPQHVHETSAELLYVEQGVVEMTIGEQTLRASAGDAIYIPPNTPHSATVLEAFRAVQVYVGPGPEQRFVPKPR